MRCLTHGLVCNGVFEQVKMVELSWDIRWHHNAWVMLLGTEMTMRFPTNVRARQDGRVVLRHGMTSQCVGCVVGNQDNDEISNRRVRASQDGRLVPRHGMTSRCVGRIVGNRDNNEIPNERVRASKDGWVVPRHGMTSQWVSHVVGNQDDNEMRRCCVTYDWTHTHTSGMCGPTNLNSAQVMFGW